MPRTHGMYKTREYAIWRGIFRRTVYPSRALVARYAGVTFCAEWQADFMAFYDHIGPCPSPKHTIDRIDNDRGYEPGNVRWATVAEQAKNKRNNVRIGGVCVSEYCARHGLHAGTVYSRIDRCGWTPEQAVGLEPRKRKASPRTVWMDLDGQKVCLKEYCKAKGIEYRRVTTRRNLGWTTEQAVGLEPRP